MGQVIQMRVIHFVTQVPWIALKLVVETARRSTQNVPTWLNIYMQTVMGIVVQSVNFHVTNIHVYNFHVKHVQTVMAILIQYVLHLSRSTMTPEISPCYEMNVIKT